MIGKRIKELREQKGLTQGELAELIGNDGNTISRWERNKIGVGNKYIVKLAQALDAPVSYLMEMETDDPRPAASKGEADTKAQAQTEPEQLLIEDKGAGYKDVSASRGVLEYEFKDGRKIKLPDTSDNRAFFQEIVRGDLKQLAY
ncbi:MAG: helix-turn-helix transcriptional regulator [Synergistaceae bacterium]|nr:helix-turn-helix transcriptional regulator [Synergistaceae bacterium]